VTDMLLLVAGLASAAAWLWIIYRADRFQREPLKRLLHVGIVGGFASALAASVGNLAMMAILGIPGDLDSGLPPLLAGGFSLFVGFNEELCKAAATVFLVRRMRDFDEPVDAVVYGMTVALGFAAFENLEYVGSGGMPVLIARTLTSMPLHIGLAALWGAGIAKARFRAGDAWVGSLLPFYLVAALLHATYDFALFAWPGSAAVALITLPSLVATLVVARRIVKGLVRQSPFRPASTCPACDRPNPTGARFCAKCGASLGSAPATGCRACGAVIPLEAAFCPACGEGTADAGDTVRRPVS